MVGSLDCRQWCVFVIVDGMMIFVVTKLGICKNGLLYFVTSC